MKNPNANVVLAIRTKKANVPANLHELLSTAKNRPEMNIRTEGQRSYFFNPITSYLASSYTFNANIALNFSLFTS